MHFLCYFSKSKTGKFYDTVFLGWQDLNKQGSLDTEKVAFVLIAVCFELSSTLISNTSGKCQDQLLTLDHSSADTMMITF